MYVCVCVCVCLCIYECNTYLRWSIKGVGIKDGLDHDEGLGEVLSHELVSVVGTLVWAVVEHL